MAQSETKAIATFLGRVPSADIHHAIPALVFDLVRLEPDIEIPTAVGDVVRSWMDAHRLNPASSLEQILQALRRTYDEKPLAHDLRNEFAVLIASLARERESQTFRTLLGDDNCAVPVLGAAPAAGQTKNSPLARFKLQKSTK